MTASFLAWSYSRLKTFRECPGKLWHTAVASKGHPDRVEYFETAPMRAGKDVDAALTARIVSGTPLPAKYAQHEGIAEVILAQPGSKLGQVQLALDQALRPCGYKQWDTAWVRVIYDVVVINGVYVFIGDYKNGQMWIDEDQLRLFATVAFHVYPEVNVADTSYIWLAHGHLSPKTYYRADLPEMWQSFLPDVERMQVSFKTQHWPKTPSPRACGYCEVNREGKCPVAAVKYKGSR